MDKLIADYEKQHQQTSAALDAYFKERTALQKLSEQIPSFPIRMAEKIAK